MFPNYEEILMSRLTNLGELADALANEITIEAESRPILPVEEREVRALELIALELHIARHKEQD